MRESGFVLPPRQAVRGGGKVEGRGRVGKEEVAQLAETNAG